MGWASNPSATNVKDTIFGGMFNLWHVIGHHWHSRMGGEFIPQSAWARLEKDDNLVETIWTSKITYAKPFKVAWGVLIGHQNLISVTKQKKWMQYQSIMVQNLFMDGMFAYLNYFFINIICIY
jgi:hypothetical protein